MPILSKECQQVLTQYGTEILQLMRERGMPLILSQRLPEIIADDLRGYDQAEAIRQARSLAWRELTTLYSGSLDVRNYTYVNGKYTVIVMDANYMKWMTDSLANEPVNQEFKFVDPYVDSRYILASTGLNEASIDFEFDVTCYVK